jgi:hypothetical protein
MALCYSMVVARVDGFRFHGNDSMGGRRIPWKASGGGCNNVDPVRNLFLNVVQVHITIHDTDTACRSRPLW